MGVVHPCPPLASHPSPPLPASMEFLFAHALHDSEKEKQHLSDFRTQELDAIATLLRAPTPVLSPQADLVSCTIASSPPVASARVVSGGTGLTGALLHVSFSVAGFSRRPTSSAASLQRRTPAASVAAPSSSSQPRPPHPSDRCPPSWSHPRLCLCLYVCRSIHECWGHGSTLDECVEAVRRYPVERMAPYLSAGSTFCIRIQAYGHTFDAEAQQSMISRFAFLPVQSTLSFTATDHRYWLLFHFSDAHQRSSSQLSHVYFCREVSRRQQRGEGRARPITCLSV